MERDRPCRAVAEVEGGVDDMRQVQVDNVFARNVATRRPMQSECPVFSVNAQNAEQI